MSMSIKYSLISEHKRAVKNGEYQYAHTILQLLRNCRVKVGLSKTDYMVEYFCEKIGCRISYGRDFNTAIIRF